jgi:ketosteroid isomerase-like protein
MSQENVEVVRRAIEAFNRGDLDGFARDADPEIEVDWSRSRGLEAGVYRGDGAAQRFVKTFFDAFEEVTVIPEELIEVGDHVVIANRARLRGRDGIEVQARSGQVVTLRAGRIVRWTLYQEKAEALEAVGLRE